LANHYFKFKQFTIWQDKCAMKVTTDACLFGSLLPYSAIHKKALDIGTGTGLLSLMYAQKNPTHSIDAVEIDAEAAIQAAQNVAQSPWPNAIQIQHTDILQFSPKSKYDIIFCNPPFYENDLKGKVYARNVAHHDEGLKLPLLLATIANLLQQDGCFFLLLPYKRYDEIKKSLGASSLGLTAVTLVRQSIHHSYFRVILHGHKKEISTVIEKELSICQSDHNYTTDFIQLLQNYYLYL
jgi:tRNA1Val (adenine37-N6)-methyltransferase